LAKPTRATPEIAAYPYTTRQPLVGMMPWEDVFIQLVDTPPISIDLMETYMQGVIRGADLVLLVVDLGCDDGIELCQDVLDRLNQTKTRLGRESYLDRSDVGRSYTRTFVVANKSDAPEFEQRVQLLDELCPMEFDRFVVSCESLNGLEELNHAIYQALDLVRVYTKSPSEKEPRFENPFTIRRGETLMEVAVQIHADFAEKLKSAKVWGSQVHGGTQVKADYVPADRDVVEIQLR